MTRLSSSSIKLLTEAAHVAVASPISGSFVILCSIQDTDPVAFTPLTDGSGSLKTYGTRSAALRAIQRVKFIPASEVPTLSRHFINYTQGAELC